MLTNRRKSGHRGDTGSRTATGNDGRTSDVTSYFERFEERERRQRIHARRADAGSAPVQV